jgi:uncharacterized protein GlcG (DUF336 family)
MALGSDSSIAPLKDPPMTALTLAQARLIIDTAFEGAARRKVANAIVVVTDPGGALKAVQRSDSAGSAGVDIATAKARTAIGFKRSTINMAAFRDNAAVTATLAGVLDGRFMPMGGGVAIIDAQGELVGAAAYSGASADIDHEIITEAVQAAGFAILD